MAKESQEGLTAKKDENFSEWYQQLILKSGLADYSSVSGCIVFRPLSYQMWEKVKEECDKHFKKSGIQNAYFPLFIPEKAFEKEKDHVEGFTPEVAWVTQAGETILNEKLAVRPTSEAIMYESYSKWIRSWRDLPLRLNQWNNAVRWEFNNPVPFFRTREFLWNEGHSAFASEKEALNEKKDILSAYESVTKELMALYGITGRKTDKEKFAGALFSEKIHYFIPNGRVIEGPCFHHDGQNFAKAYDIKFLDKDGKEDYAWQNTYAISTRMLGTMFAVHSDDKGLVIPPKMAQNQIVIIPILFDKTKEKVLKEAQKIMSELKEFNPIFDDRVDISPGRKYHEWELKGIPLRIEIGPKDLENKQVTIVKRNDGKKVQIKIKDLKKEVTQLLKKIQDELYENSKKLMLNKIKKTQDKKEMIKIINERKVAIVPLSNSHDEEEKLKEITGGAKTLFIDPKNQSVKGIKSIISAKQADYWVYIGKTY